MRFPYAIGPDGRTEECTPQERIPQLIELVLFTAPGERVMRPEFGTALESLVFAGENASLLSATQFMIQAALQSSLAMDAKVDGVDVSFEGETLRIVVRYLVLATGEARMAKFEQPV